MHIACVLTIYRGCEYRDIVTTELNESDVNNCDVVKLTPGHARAYYTTLYTSSRVLSRIFNLV